MAARLIARAPQLRQGDVLQYLAAHCDDCPRGYQGPDPQGAHGEGERERVCRRARNAVRGAGDLTGDAERAHIWVGCGSNRR